MQCRKGIDREYTKHGKSAWPRLQVLRAPLVWKICNIYWSTSTDITKIIVKSFNTEDDAKLYLAGEDPSLNPQSSSYTPKFYGVKTGKVPGVYTSWVDAKIQVVGTSKPKVRCFSTREEAEAFVNGILFETPAGSTKASSDGASTGKRSPSSRSESPPSIVGKKRKINTQPFPHPTTSFTSVNTTPPPHKALALNHLLVGGDDALSRTNTNSPHTTPAPSDRSTPPSHTTSPQTAARTMAAIRRKPDISTLLSPTEHSPPRKAEPLRIYTDGSKLKSPTATSIGLWFGPNDPDNTSSPPNGSNDNNEKGGEALTAILRALEIAPRHRDVLIHTNSIYAINCISVWCHGWSRDGWVTENGQDVEHREVIEGIQVRIREREECGVRTGFEWVRGSEKQAAELLNNVKVEQSSLEDSEDIVTKKEDVMA